MNGPMRWVCVLLGLFCVGLGLMGCRKTRVTVQATVNTQRASLKEITKGTLGQYGGLSARLDMILGQQSETAARLHRAIGEARSLQHQVSQMAAAWEEAVREETQGILDCAAEGSKYLSPSDPSRGERQGTCRSFLNSNP